MSSKQNKLSDEQLETLNTIVRLNGHCLHSENCSNCPLKRVCLPEFLNKAPSKPQRRELASTILAHYHIFDEVIDIEEYYDAIKRR